MASLGHDQATSVPKPEDVHRLDEPFRPLRPASRPKLIAAIVLGPALWLVALGIAAVVLARTDAIEIGLLLTAASLALAAAVLSLLRLGRRREERRYVDGA
jgi:hypothetical protein